MPAKPTSNNQLTQPNAVRAKLADQGLSEGDVADAVSWARPQIIDTPGGERMVVLPLKEYDQLREAAEDLADVQAYDEARRRLAAGEDELIPAEFAERILDGERPVRVWREFRGFSVKELAGRADISAAYLSQIEGGSREGSISTMKAVAAALSLDLGDLV